MTDRLGDGADDKAGTLGGGAFDPDPSTLGAKGALFLGLRSTRHEINLLGSAGTLHAVPDQSSIAGAGPSAGAGAGGDGGDGGGGGGGDGSGSGGGEAAGP